MFEQRMSGWGTYLGIGEMRKKKPERKRTNSWRVFRDRGASAVFVGVVDASNDANAIIAAIEKYKITDPEQQKRLVAEKRD